MNEPDASPIHPRFAGRSVLVTGAGTGFGRAIAIRAAKEGARVGVHYNRSRDGAEKTAEQIREFGAEATLFQADISRWSDVESLANEVFAALDGLDVLVNNVGDVATEQMSWRELTQEALDRVIDVDLKGTLMMCHEFGQRMLDQGHGAIVNIGSTVVVRGSARAPQYAAAKYGLLGVTKSYASAFAPQVRVNTFAPGFMETEATVSREDWRTGRRERLVSQTPLGTIPPPSVVAGTALFLASDDASHMTGALVVSDGGFNMIGA